MGGTAKYYEGIGWQKNLGAGVAKRFWGRNGEKFGDNKNIFRGIAKMGGGGGKNSHHSGVVNIQV